MNQLQCGMLLEACNKAFGQSFQMSDLVRHDNRPALSDVRRAFCYIAKHKRKQLTYRQLGTLLERDWATIHGIIRRQQDHIDVYQADRKRIATAIRYYDQQLNDLMR